MRIAKADLVPTEANLGECLSGHGHAGRGVRRVLRARSTPGGTGRPARSRPSGWLVERRAAACAALGAVCRRARARPGWSTPIRRSGSGRCATPPHPGWSAPRCGSAPPGDELVIVADLNSAGACARRGRRRRRPGWSRSPATPCRPRDGRGSSWPTTPATRKTRPGRRDRRHRKPTSAAETAFLALGPGRRGVAGRGRRRRRGAGAGEDGRRGRARRPGRTRRGRRRARGRRRGRAGSPRTTCSPSCATAPPAPRPRNWWSPTRRTPRSRAPPPGRGSADDHPEHHQPDPGARAARRRCRRSPWILLDRTTVAQAATVLDRLEQWLAGAGDAGAVAVLRARLLAGRGRRGQRRRLGRAPSPHRLRSTASHEADHGRDRATRPAAAARRADRAAAPDAAALPAQRRPRRPRHRPRATLGPRRDPAGAARRGGRRPRRRHPPPTPPRRRSPGREDLRVLAGGRQLHPHPHPARPGHPGVDRPRGEPRRHRPVRHRQDPPGRGPRARRDRHRPPGRLVHPRIADRRRRPGRRRTARSPAPSPRSPART